MTKERFKHKLTHDLERLTITIKWVIFAVITGIILGILGTMFIKCINWATNIRTEHPYFLLFLPVGAVMILYFYKLLGTEKSRGTNLVISAIHSGDEIPLRMAPLIFFSTIFSHLCGASVGREGAALQLGGSIGNVLGKIFRFTERDQHVMIMCGMSASFSALFGTPMAAAIFSIEIVSVGIMHYAALVPCVISALVARGIAMYFGISSPIYSILNIPDFNITNALLISLLAILLGILSMGICILLHKGDTLSLKIFKNPYIRAAVFGAIILGITFIIGNQNYSGTGIDMIMGFIGGNVKPYDFALKLLLTVLAILAGYKGGEIIPTFFIGAAFGSLFGIITGLSPSLCAAVGMGALFCGVTNCPITSILICLELFGLDGMPYYLLSVALSYMVSGYYSLYSSQRIVYSKYKSNYINKKTH